MKPTELRKNAFAVALDEKARQVNKVLKEFVDGQAGMSDRLKKAVSYTLNAPGKRIRGALVLWCCELVSGKVNRTAEVSAAAIEMVHTYSLIHDDLPAMDDDDMRRGQPSCHKAFGEATAILTGDALLTLAFEFLADEVSEPEVAVRLIKVLAAAAGPAGMIEGQMADLQSENAEGTFAMLQHIHTNKTAKMFAAAARMGAISGGAGDEEVNCLGEYGLKIGLAFQVADDILDVSASSEHLGKTAGKDAEQGKVTCSSVLGLAKSKKIAEKLSIEAIETLKGFGDKADILRQLAEELLSRTR